jgi:hypothetical protein
VPTIVDISNVRMISDARSRRNLLVVLDYLSLGFQLGHFRPSLGVLRASGQVSRKL